MCKQTNLEIVALPQHLESQHKRRFYECIFCEESFELILTLQNHLSNNHPEKPLFVCARIDFEMHVSLSEVQNY